MEGGEKWKEERGVALFFFFWFRSERLSLPSPMRRTHKIKNQKSKKGGGGFEVEHEPPNPPPP